MQRWMLWVGLGVVGLVLMFFGARFAWREYHLSKPDKVWVPLALQTDLSMADQQKLADQINGRLRSDEILRKVVADIGLQEKFGQTSEDATVKELDRRLFVEVGSADTPTGLVPSINIGVRGIGHEHDLLGEAATRIMQDVWVMIGIDPKTGTRIEQPPLTPPSGF
jgi:hypothetical protein